MNEYRSSSSLSFGKPSEREVERTSQILFGKIRANSKILRSDLFSIGAAHLESGGADTDGRQGGDGSYGGSRRDGRRTESQVDTSLAMGNLISGLNLEWDRLTKSLSAFTKRFDFRLHGWTLFPNIIHKSVHQKTCFQRECNERKQDIYFG